MWTDREDSRFFQWLLAIDFLGSDVSTEFEIRTEKFVKNLKQMVLRDFRLGAWSDYPLFFPRFFGVAGVTRCPKNDC